MDIKKIDLHVHTNIAGGPERLRGGTWPTPEALREIYDSLNIEKGVAMPREAPERSHDAITTRDVQYLSKTYPETLGWWFCYLDPRMGTNSPSDNLSYYLDFYKERGAKGVGELQANMYIDDKRMLNLLYRCQQCNMPVTVHFGKLGEGCGLADDIGLPRLERVLEMFPKLKILGHAMTFWAEISDNVEESSRNGYPSGKIVNEGRLPELMRKYPNLYCDLSAKSGYNAIARDEEYGCRFLEEFNERIFYATDISSPESIEGPAKAMAVFLDTAYENGKISRKAYQNICRDNAVRLLGVN